MKTNNSLFQLFLWLSNTDPKLFSNVPTTSQLNRIGLSLFVLLTGIFAFLSGSFFVRTMFASYNDLTKTTEVGVIGWVVSLIVGVIWMIFIINLDRMIISSSNKYMAFLRIPLAIAIGLIIAIPFEVQLFKSRITKELITVNKDENKEHLFRFQNAVDANNNEETRLVKDIEKEKKEISYWQSVMEAEIVGRVKDGRTGKAGKGAAYKEAEKNRDLHQKYYNQSVKNLTSIRSKIPRIKENAFSEYKQLKVEQSYDFASLFEAFSNLKEKPENKSLKYLALCITLLFVLIEITPALMKLLSEKDTYDKLLLSQAYLNEQSLNVLTNFYMEEISNKKQLILDKSNFEFQPKNSMTKIVNTLN